MAYVVTRGGIFGTLERTYLNEQGAQCAIVRYGSFLTPVLAVDVRHLRSTFESEARREAEVWLTALHAAPKEGA